MPGGAIRIFHLLLLRLEGVPVLEGHELVQRREDGEEGARELPLPLEVRKPKLPRHTRADHVMELTQHVAKRNGLVVQALHSLDLLLVEVLQLVISHHAVRIQVEDVEPELNGSVGDLILVVQQKVDEVLVPHLAGNCRCKPPGDLAEDAIHRPSGKRVPVILQQVILVKQEVVVRVQLPECTVDHIKVLIAEVVPDHLHVVELLQLLPCLYNGRLVSPQAGELNAPGALPVVDVENAAGHRIGVPVLELLGLQQKVQPRVGHENGMQEDVEVLLLYPVVVVLFHHGVEAERGVLRLNLPARPADHHHLGDGHRRRHHHSIALRDGGAVDDVIKHLHLMENRCCKVLGQLEDVSDNGLALLPRLDTIGDALLHKDLVDLVFVLLPEP
mmetsp:Transcript_83469/g.200285  ORF Transcript_83469/g.200285 Transcript_83469/m.200285 type:complete len:387 (+) Transcript_83469:233-1393(+)